MAVALQLLFNVLIGGSVNALLGVGMQLVYSTTRVLNLAHGATVLIAGYASFEMGKSGHPFPIALLAAVAIAVLVGLSMEALFFAPMRRRGATGFALLLASFALLAVGVNALLMRYTAGTVRPPSPFSGKSWMLAGAAITPLQATILCVTLVLLLGFAGLLKWTKIGIAFRAVADHEDVAAIVGVSVSRAQLLAFVVASVIGGVTGALFAPELNLNPELATLYAVKGFAAVIIGGAGSIPGAIIGGLLLSALQQLGAYLIGGGWQDAIVYGLVFVFLIVRPQGLFGKRT